MNFTTIRLLTLWLTYLASVKVVVRQSFTKFAALPLILLSVMLFACEKEEVNPEFEDERLKLSHHQVSAAYLQTNKMYHFFNEDNKPYVVVSSVLTSENFEVLKNLSSDTLILYNNGKNISCERGNEYVFSRSGLQVNDLSFQRYEFGYRPFASFPAAKFTYEGYIWDFRNDVVVSGENGIVLEGLFKRHSNETSVVQSGENTYYLSQDDEMCGFILWQYNGKYFSKVYPELLVN